MLATPPPPSTSPLLYHQPTFLWVLVTTLCHTPQPWPLSTALTIGPANFELFVMNGVDWPCFLVLFLVDVHDQPKDFYINSLK